MLFNKFQEYKIAFLKIESKKLSNRKIYKLNKIVVIMENLILKELGYTEREIRVYEALLSLGKTTAGPIAAKAKLAHTKVYDTLQRLVDKGLVSFIIISKTKYFLAEDPNEILNKYDEKRERIFLLSIQLGMLVLEIRKPIYLWKWCLGFYKIKLCFEMLVL